MDTRGERLDHRGVIAALSPAERELLRRRADGPGLVRLALHGGAVLALGGWIAARAPLWPLAMVAQGAAVIFLFSMLHETIHGTAFATPWINRAAARIGGFALVLPCEWFRYFHLAHHRHTQDSARDPELAAAKPATLAQYLAHVSGLPVWWSQVRTLWRNALGRCGDAFVPLAARDAVRREARVAVAGYALVLGASVAAGSTAALDTWILPALLGQPLLRLFLLAEHGRCPLVASMLENTRTTFTTPLLRGLAWNMPFHAEHHVDPSVPFHRLPALHALIGAHLRVTERGYGRFHRRYLAGLRHRD